MVEIETATVIRRYTEYLKNSALRSTRVGVCEYTCEYVRLRAASYTISRAPERARAHEIDRMAGWPRDQSCKFIRLNYVTG